MATKNPSKKSPAKGASKKDLGKSAAGKSAVVKGRSFEDDVANLYRLQGAEIIQNIEICNKKVDILVTFSHPVRHRIIVECKGEEKPNNANQRVMQFHGLLASARKTGEAESAEIITKTPWGDAAKGYANREGIRLLTYTEKISSLIDFTGYLKELIRKFEKLDPSRPSEPSLGKYYVDLSAVRFVNRQEVKIDVLDTYINQWLQGNGDLRHLAIFGEYGAGKSTFCQKLARDLSSSFLRDPHSSRIPILLNLREFIGKLDIEAYITSFLDRECKAISPKINLFRAMNDAGIFLLLFDGLDEMAVKVEADTLESNLIEIEKLALSSNSKVILTSRPEFFVSLKEEQEVISPALNPLLSRKARYEPIKILPWDDSQVEQFLKRRVPLVENIVLNDPNAPPADSSSKPRETRRSISSLKPRETRQSITMEVKPWTFYRDKIKEIGTLSDLSHRPVLLDMIVKTLPALIAGNIHINRPNLYRTYLVGEIKRQKVYKKRTLLISENDRFSLLQKMAVAVYKGTIPAINFTDASNLIAQEVAPPKYEMEAHVRDFLTNSFLIRRGDEYHFSHKSILEFLVASQFDSEIRSGIPESFGTTPIQTAITDFLKDFKPDINTLFRWIEETKGKRYRAMRFLGGNSATLVCSLSKDALVGKDLSSTDLTGADLESANLDGVKLDGTLLHQAKLAGARFSQEQFAVAYLQNVTLLFLIVEPKMVTGEFNEKCSQIVRSIPQLKKNAFSRITISIDHAGGRYSSAALTMSVSRKEHLRMLLKHLRKSFSHVAIYSNDIEQLIKTYPQCQQLLSRWV